MKTALTTGYTFTASTRQLDFSTLSGFDIRRLFAVVNLTRKTLIYAVGKSGLGYSALSSSVVTLEFNTTTYADGDALCVVYDSPVSAGGGDASAANQTTQIASLGAIGDSAYAGSGSASIIAIAKGLYAKLGAVVLAAGTAVIGKVGLQVGGSDVSNSVPVPVSDAGGSITVDATALPLPTGAATAAKQPALGTAGTASADVITVQGATSMTALKVDGSAITQPVSASALPLPAGAATSAAQGTGNTSLSNLDTKLGEVQTTPTANTLLGRLKDLYTAITGTLTVVAGGYSAVASANFNRPADTTAYAVGDLVANSTTAGSVTPMAIAVARVNAGTGIIPRARLTKSGTSRTNALFTAHLFKSSPTVSNGDNGAFLTDGALHHIGSFDFDMTTTNTAVRVFTDGVKCIAVPNVGSSILFETNSGVTNLYVLLEARGAYTPISSETFTFAAEVSRD